MLEIRAKINDIADLCISKNRDRKMVAFSTLFLTVLKGLWDNLLIVHVLIHMQLNVLEFLDKQEQTKEIW